MGNEPIRREAPSQALNDRVVALETTVQYIERDVIEHKVQTERQFKTLNDTINRQFEAIDRKIDTLTEAVTSNRVSIAKIFGIGSFLAVVASSILAIIVKLFGG